DLSRITAYAREQAPQRKVVHSDPDQYWKQRAKTETGLPVVTQSLNPFATGCYTSQIRIKQRYRALENEYFQTERMAMAAVAQGLMAYPFGELSEAERDLLFAQFHDILPGSSVPAAEEASLRLMDHGLEILSRVKWRAFFALTAGQPAASPSTFPILVYNPHPHVVTTELECELQLEDQNWTDTISIPTVRQGARLVPAQLEREASNIALDWRKKIVFRARLAPFAMNRFVVTFQRKPAVSGRGRSTRSFAAPGRTYCLRHRDIEVGFDPSTGSLSELKLGRHIVIGAPCRFLVIATDGDPWSMGTHSFRKVIGAFTSMSARAAGNFVGAASRSVPPLRIIEEGDVRVVVESLLTYRQSSMVVRYFIPRTGRRIQVDIHVWWNEPDKMLKWSLPTALTGGAHGETVFGSDPAAAGGRESLAQRWIVVRDADTALTIITTGTYGYDFEDGELRLSLLRSAAFSAHPIPNRPLVTDEQYRDRIDRGARRFQFFLEPGPVGDRLAKVTNESAVCNQPLPILNHFPASPRRAVPPPWLRLSNPNVELVALKPGKKTGTIVMRLFAPTQRAEQTKVSFDEIDWSFRVTLRGFEVKTMIVNFKLREARPADLLERIRSRATIR
ncbi:MAG: alpha-mannosidase, partial [Bryobacterales bacterium]|nr:alpha-mannosidase [Bryobacterales bacterium]